MGRLDVCLLLAHLPAMLSVNRQCPHPHEEHPQRNKENHQDSQQHWHTLALPLSCPSSSLHTHLNDDLNCFVNDPHVREHPVLCRAHLDDRA